MKLSAYFPLLAIFAAEFALAVPKEYNAANRGCNDKISSSDTSTPTGLPPVIVRNAIPCTADPDCVDYADRPICSSTDIQDGSICASIPMATAGFGNVCGGPFVCNSENTCVSTMKVGYATCGRAATALAGLNSECTPGAKCIDGYYCTQSSLQAAATCGQMPTATLPFDASCTSPNVCSKSLTCTNYDNATSRCRSYDSPTITCTPGSISLADGAQCSAMTSDCTRCREGLYCSPTADKRAYCRPTGT